MLNPARIFLGLFVFIILSVFSCMPPDTDNDGLADGIDKCPKVSAKTKGGCLIKRQVKNVHLYIETSTSMGGYLNKNTEFKTVIMDIASKVNGEIKPLDIWFIADKPVKYEGTVQFL